ncbi:ATP-dependent DNA helicase RecG [uncultured Fretibacterium sp.]|uniref:ATP-dependent DNA helicase RecG n=1 Tax=uncultured Fretibacterium sp. TaxID=1678694 RepID=UPI00260B5416|nr:ATP-dependent DNA helicase RecG [uncultured Fretibacterium sp.]
MPDLTLSIRFLRGVGEKRAQAFARLGIFTVEDLLFFFPRRYEDRRTLTPLGDLRPDTFSAVVAEVASLSARPAGYRSGPFSISLIDGIQTVRAVWFNNPRLELQLRPGMRLALYGRVEYRGGLQLTNPEFEVLEGDEVETASVGRIVPVYPLAAPLSQRWTRRLVGTVLASYGGGLTDFLPDSLRRRHGMKTLPDAVRELHCPEDRNSWLRARNRLAFDELFLLQIGLLLRRRTYAASGYAVPIRPGRKFQALMGPGLPFVPTGAQRRAVAEILGDMNSKTPMNRLLQGDVGSGKTFVASAAILAAADSGVQSVFMAPTEILAQQHYFNLKGMLRSQGIETVLLTGGQRAAERRSVEEAIRGGSAQVVVGTHAVFGDEVSFARLGLVIVDEQHRFGVLQKNSLMAKASAPHVLVMTATPIPRTLVLSIYGDLEVSVLGELPPGRTPIRTVRMSAGMEKTLLDLVREHIRRGRQVYWVCPLIEDEEQGEPRAVVSRFGRLSSVLPEARIAMLHGRLSMGEKENIMRGFSEGKTDLLVATVVIEVGLDVPNATVMIVEDAGRFGLAQLHQLRGRVGRGRAEGVCILLEGRETSPDGRARIETMLRTSSGFDLAEEDLKQRGPGEVCGIRQHGVTDFRVADLVRDRKLLSLARDEARRLLETDPWLESAPLLKEELDKRLGRALKLAGTA